MKTPVVKRADARRNQARILEAAETVFAAQGITASTEDIALQAGVGIGTVFRHFPTKEALIEAIFEARLRHLANDANALLGASDAGEAFFTFFAHMVEHGTTKKTFAEALAQTGLDARIAKSPIARDVLRALENLLGRAQAAGAVRADATVADIVALVVGNSRAAEHAVGDPAVQARTLAIVCDGLRAGPA